MTPTHIVYHTQTLLLCPETESEGGRGDGDAEGSKVGRAVLYVKWMDNTLYRLSRAGRTAVNMRRKFRQWLGSSGMDGSATAT